MRSWPALEIAAPDDLVQAALTDFDVAAIDDNAPDMWRVFFHTDDARAQAAASLRRQFNDLSVSAVDVPDEDWAARSQANLKAVRVGNIIVAPPWDVGRAEALPHTAVAPRGSSVAQGFNPAITIVIQPSMGFGTGHHPTTRLCLAHLQQLELRNQTVIDVGTGSGVLAMAASRLGATHVLAIDDDADAIQSARQNIDLNPGIEVTLGVVDVRRAVLKPFDVILANLTGGLLIASTPALLSLSAPKGRFILSGFMDSEEQNALAAFSSCAIEQRSQEDEWVCVTLLRAR
jgi:ribosomal protein L11 methyltransferase